MKVLQPAALFYTTFIVQLSYNNGKITTTKTDSNFAMSFSMMVMMIMMMRGMMVERVVVKDTCEEISIPMCKEIGYNFTRLPNQFNHQTQDEVKRKYFFFAYLRANS